VTAAARSILAYAIYLFAQGFTLLAIPNIALSIFGLPQTSEVWVRVTGMTLAFFGIYYVLAARNEWRPFFQATVFTRLAVPFVFLAFIGAGYATANLLLFTSLDIAFAAWTWVALRREPIATRSAA
jgi:hypothetical protein